MTISMHSASVPIFARMLGNLLTWLDKAEAHAIARKFDPSVYLASRLAPDMLPFTNQIQIASDGAKGCIARLTGTEIPKWEDNEKTLDDLRGRIRKTIDYVQSVSEAQFADADTREVLLPRRTGDPVKFTGENFLKQFALPNFYFHATTAYDIIRQCGVEVGKRDFMGSPPA